MSSKSSVLMSPRLAKSPGKEGLNSIAEPPVQPPIAQPPIAQPPIAQPPVSQARIAPPPIPMQNGTNFEGDEEGLLTNPIMGLMVIHFSIVCILLAASLYTVLQFDSFRLAEQLDPVDSNELVAVQPSHTIPNLAKESETVSDGIVASNPTNDLANSDVEQTVRDIKAATSNSFDKKIVKQGVAHFVTAMVSLHGFSRTTPAEADPVPQSDNETLPVSNVAPPQTNDLISNPQESAASQTCPPPKPQVGAPNYGTQIEWTRLVDEAASKAKSENKLIFLMHVSGNFTKEEFT